MLFINFFQFSDDKLLQSIAAHNFSRGEGLVYHEVHAMDLNEEIRTPLHRWPPGYSLTIAFIYKITKNLILSTIILDVIFIILFFLLLRILLQKLAMPAYLINLLILYNGFTITEYVAKPTDIHAVVLILMSVYAVLNFYEFRSRPFRSGIYLGVLAFLPCFFRYMYIPASLVIGAVILCAGVVQKDDKLKKCGLCSLVTTTICIISLLAFNTFFAGSPAYIMPMTKGIFPSNLLQMYPFLFGSFMNINFILTQLELLSSYRYEFWYSILRYLNIIVCIILVLKFISIKKIFNGKWSAAKMFFVVAFSMIAITILLTCYLSMNNGLFRISLNNVRPWTFVGDARYFSLPIIIIPLAVTYYLFVIKLDSRKQLIVYCRTLLIALIFFDFIHTTWFIVRKFNYSEPFQNTTFPTEVSKYLTARIDEIKRNKFDIVLTGYREKVGYWATLNGAKGLMNCDEIIGSVLRARHETVMMVVLEKKDIPFCQPLLRSINKNSETIIQDFYIYSFHVLTNR